MDVASKQQELEVLRSRVKLLEAEIAAEQLANWQVSRDYPAYYATGGFLLGIVGAMASLLFNVLGSLIAGKDPLELIRVYLTFPLGERALQLSGASGSNAYAVGDGLIIAFGCCLYLATGMLLGVIVVLALVKLAPRGSLVKRLIVGGSVALVIWLVNFYGILSWLQPLLFKGNWIIDSSRLPWWVAAATHVVFGWTIAVLLPMVSGDPDRIEAAKTA